jgi:exopolysaccharide biosynthesis protein
MKHNILRWCLAILMLIGLAMILSSPALADEAALPWDLKVHGNAPRPSGRISETEYQDDTIHVTVYSASRKPKSSESSITCRWAVIEIAHPSQLRTTISMENYNDPTQATAIDMARSVNAIVACNSDFIKYTYNIGYVARQGVLYRNKADGMRDVLIIDEKGDFEVVPKATEADMEAKEQEMEAQGRQIINAFSFGPMLVKDGEVQELSANSFESERVECFLPTQRIAIAQLDTLKYAIISIDGGVVNGSGMNGMNLKELANYIVSLFPECKLAYNLDGGASSRLVFMGKKISVGPSRTISDMIYFASAATGD